MAGLDPLTTFEALFRAILVERNVDAFMALWADDDDITMWGSDLPERARGRDEIRALGGTLALSPLEISFIWDERYVHEEGDAAWVAAAGAFNGVPYRMLAVLVRRQGEWRWHTLHGSEPR